MVTPDISDEFSCNLVPGDTNWNGDICYFKIEMNQTVCTDVINGEWQNEECYIACTSNEVCCENIEGNWNGDECIDLPSGIWITGEEKLTISNEISIDNFQSLNADIECIIDTSYSVELPVNEDMILIEGHISDMVDIDTNRIAFDLTNNFFTDITFEISSENLIDFNNEPLFNSQIISEGESFQDVIISDYTIKKLNGGSVDSLSIGYSVVVAENSAVLNFDEPYGLVGDGIESKTIK